MRAFWEFFNLICEIEVNYQQLFLPDSICLRVEKDNVAMKAIRMLNWARRRTFVLPRELLHRQRMRAIGHADTASISKYHNKRTSPSTDHSTGQPAACSFSTTDATIGIKTVPETTSSSASSSNPANANTEHQMSLALASTDINKAMEVDIGAEKADKMELDGEEENLSSDRGDAINMTSQENIFLLAPAVEEEKLALLDARTGTSSSPKITAISKAEARDAPEILDVDNDKRKLTTVPSTNTTSLLLQESTSTNSTTSTTTTSAMLLQSSMSASTSVPSSNITGSACVSVSSTSSAVPTLSRTALNEDPWLASRGTMDPQEYFLIRTRNLRNLEDDDPEDYTADCVGFTLHCSDDIFRNIMKFV
ncbi:unnamed protein product [Amoebophrya sp. A25]|nr:unnamed protein product [Amoebophrya sp. A25]|eukprot:GSA25T00014579001.1